MSEHSSEVPAVSRRTLMKTAAGAGVAAATVGIVGVANAGPGQRTAGATGSAPPGNTAHGHAAGPIVVHVTDVRTGSIDVFVEDAHTQITDVDLAARIARAALEA